MLLGDALSAVQLWWAVPMSRAIVPQGQSQRNFLVRANDLMVILDGVSDLSGLGSLIPKTG